MENYTTFTNQEVFRKELLAISTKLESTYKRVHVALTEDFVPVKKDAYQFITQLLKPSSNIERVFYSSLYENIYKSETLSGDSAKIALGFSCAFLKELLTSQTCYSEEELQSAFQSSWDRFRDTVEQLSRVATESTLRRQIEASCGRDNSNLATAVWEAANLAGLDGKIVVESQKRGQKNFLVESTSGFNFRLNPFEWMLNKETKSWSRTSVKVFLVDGIVEKVSELDHLFNQAYETKQPFLIVSHGFSEEVAATCKSNNDSGAFDVMLVRMHHDINSINIISDIGVVCNSTPLTPHLGQIITCAKWDELPVVEKVTVTPKSTVIVADNNQPGLGIHIRGLVHKRQDADTIEDIREIIDSRLRSLVSRTVTLYLPDVSPVTEDSYRVCVDTSLRNIKTVLNNGIVNVQELLMFLEEGWCVTPLDGFLVMALQDTLEQQAEVQTEMPALSLVLATLMAGKTCIALYSSAGMIAPDTTTS